MIKASRFLAIICVAILLVSGAGCVLAPSQPEAKQQVVTVQRGNLAVSVSVDGNLVMPQAFDLRFGAPGNVEKVLVEEGDFVKAGTILAKLDDTPQQLDIQSANCALQLALSNLYETIPAIQQGFMGNPDQYLQTPGNAGFPSYYPNSSALLSVGWFQQEVAQARSFLLLGRYSEAASELRMAVFDLESCKRIFQDGIGTLQPALTNVAPLASQETLSWIQEDSIWGIVEQLQKVVACIEQGQSELGQIQSLITQGNYSRAVSMFEDAAGRLDDISRKVLSNVNVVKKRYDMSYPSKALCLYFYGAAEESLDKALALIEQGGLNSAEYNENLRAARHYLELNNSIMGSNVLVLEHGLSLKNYQQYNVDVAKAAVTLANRKDDLLKTIIIAPFDGTVVSVGVKRNDILSAVDYSSRTAVQLVDTSAVKFQGQVDEIDILKVATGQKATIAVDAVPNKLFTGRVTFISPYGTANTSNVVKFPITIELDPADVELKGGLTATADIAVSSAENVLLLPVAAVTTTPAGSSVTVVDEAARQPEKRQVVIGNQNQQFVEIVSGLKEGDKVLIEQSKAAPVVTAPVPPPSKPGGPTPGR